MSVLRDADQALLAVGEVALILARVAFWLGIFALFLVGLLTVPIIVLIGSLLLYLLLRYVRHIHV